MCTRSVNPCNWKAFGEGIMLIMSALVRDVRVRWSQRIAILIDHHRAPSFIYASECARVAQTSRARLSMHAYVWPPLPPPPHDVEDSCYMASSSVVAAYNGISN